MTDSPKQPLNIVERMAKRMAAEAAQGVSAQPITPTFAERAVQKATPNALPALSPTPAANGSRPPQGDFPETAATTTRLAAELQHTAREERPKVTNKLIHLDFRALRQSGMITPDNMSSPLSNEYRGIKRKLLQKVRDTKTRATTNNLVMITSSLPQEGKTLYIGQFGFEPCRRTRTSGASH